MAATPALAFGKLELNYTAYGIPHVWRTWVKEFNPDSAVGTFVVPATPASLDALATELTAILKGLFNTDSGLLWGAWRGLRTINADTGAAIPITEGSITPGTGAFDTQPNPGKGVSETTFSFRDTNGKRVKFVTLGSIYYGPQPFFSSGLGGSFADFVAYAQASTVMVARNATPIASFIDVTFDTNDGATRRLRR